MPKNIFVSHDLERPQFLSATEEQDRKLQVEEEHAEIFKPLLPEVTTLKQIDEGHSQIIGGSVFEAFFKGERFSKPKLYKNNQSNKLEKTMHTDDKAITGYTFQGLPFLIVADGYYQQDSRISSNFINTQVLPLIDSYSRLFISALSDVEVDQHITTMIKKIYQLRVKHCPEYNGDFTLSLCITYERTDRLFCSGFGIGDIGIVRKLSNGPIQQLAYVNEGTGYKDGFTREHTVDELIGRNHLSRFADVEVFPQDELVSYSFLFKELQQQVREENFTTSKKNFKQQSITKTITTWSLQTKMFENNLQLLTQLHQANDDIRKKISTEIRKAVTQQDKEAEPIRNNGGDDFIMSSIIIPTPILQRKLAIVACEELNDISDYDNVIFENAMNELAKIMQDMRESQSKITFKQLWNLGALGLEVYTMQQRITFIRSLLAATDESFMQPKLALDYCIKTIGNFASKFVTMRLNTAFEDPKVSLGLEGMLVTREFYSTEFENKIVKGIVEKQKLLIEELKRNLQSAAFSEETIIPELFCVKYSESIKEVARILKTSKIPNFYLQKYSDSSNSSTSSSTRKFETMGGFAIIAEALIKVELEVQDIYSKYSLGKAPINTLQLILAVSRAPSSYRQKLIKAISVFKQNYEIYLSKHFQTNSEAPLKIDLIKKLHDSISETIQKKDILEINTLEILLIELDEAITNLNKAYNGDSWLRNKTGDVGKILAKLMDDLLKVWNASSLMYCRSITSKLLDYHAVIDFSILQLTDDTDLRERLSQLVEDSGLQLSLSSAIFSKPGIVISGASYLQQDISNWQEQESKIQRELLNQDLDPELREQLEYDAKQLRVQLRELQQNPQIADHLDLDTNNYALNLDHIFSSSSSMITSSLTDTSPKQELKERRELNRPQTPAHLVATRSFTFKHEPVLPILLPGFGDEHAPISTSSVTPPKKEFKENVGLGDQLSFAQPDNSEFSDLGRLLLGSSIRNVTQPLVETTLTSPKKESKEKEVTRDSQLSTTPSVGSNIDTLMLSPSSTTIVIPLLEETTIISPKKEFKEKEVTDDQLSSTALVEPNIDTLTLSPSSTSAVIPLLEETTFTSPKKAEDSQTPAQLAGKIGFIPKPKPDTPKPSDENTSNEKPNESIASSIYS